jgi:hypothetical protein
MELGREDEKSWLLVPSEIKLNLRLGAEGRGAPSWLHLSSIDFQ